MTNYTDDVIAKARDLGWNEWSMMDPQLYLDIQSGEVHLNLDEFKHTTGKSGERTEDNTKPVKTYEGRNLRSRT